VKDATNCTYEANNVTISRETSFGTILPAPVATTPQTFCGSATVANLQAVGTGIKWYLSEGGDDEVGATTVLTPNNIYYAAQSVGS
jgi:hypothetical protein